MYIYITRLAFMIVIIFWYHSASAQESLDSLLCRLNNSQILRLINSTDSSLKAQVLTHYEFKLPIYHPLTKLRLNSDFGIRVHPLTRQLQFHKGIDLKATLDQEVFTTADGIILHTGYSRSLGYFIKIQHLAGFTSIYGHLNRILVATNQPILQGQIIGTCGMSGKTTGVHLHYALVRNQEYLSPSLILHKD